MPAPNERLRREAAARHAYRAPGRRTRPPLSSTATALIENPENTLYVSAASIREIAIKYRKGNLPVRACNARPAFRFAGFAELSIGSDHIEGIAAQPEFGPCRSVRPLDGRPRTP
nr:hypothetical protein [Burkholderia paludis]